MSDLEINKGVELILRKGGKKSEKPKILDINFGKTVSLFKREINFYLKVTLNVIKK
jgi:hypothetical protein